MQKVISKVEQDYPETTIEFLKLTDAMYEIFLKKQADYGPSNIGMGVTKVKSKEEIQKSLLGLSVRMNDKIQRLLNLTMKNQKPNNESIEDNLLDIANYAVMSIIVNKGLWGQ